MNLALVEQILRNSTFFAGGLAAALFLLAQTRKQAILAEIGTMAMSSGLLLSTLAVILKLASGHPLIGNFFDALPYAVWAMLALYQPLAARYKSKIFGAGAGLGVFLVSLLASLLARPAAVASVQTVGFEAYVIVLQLAFGAFALSAVSALLYFLSQDRTETQLILDSQSPGFSFAAVMGYDHLEASEEPESLLILFDEITHRLVLFGFALLPLAVIMGSWWAQRAWGAYWSWSPQETACLMTWLFYGGYLHFRQSGQANAKNAAILALAGFVAVLYTCYQLNYLPWISG